MNKMEFTKAFSCFIKFTLSLMIYTVPLEFDHILGYASIPIIHSLLRDIIYQLIILRDYICVINLRLRFISRFRRFYEDFTLLFTLSIPFTSPSYLSLPVYISPSTFLSLSLLLYIILFGVSNGRFRPCFLIICC